jgi:glycosyltransferase involved in cell wall biosynthesis
MGDRPLVSVVVPTYYRNDLLPGTIRSVLDQSYDRVETVVVDDSGDAHARPIVEQFEGVRYVAFDRNRGANAARTAGARRAEGRYVHFLDDDDRLFRTKLARQVRRIEAAGDAGVVYTGIEKGNGEPVLPDPEARGDVLERALTFSLWPCMTSTMLIDGRILDEVLPLSDRAGAQDLELMIQLAARTGFEFVDAPLVRKRMDLSSLGSSLTAVDCRKQLIEEYRHLYDRYPDRVRRAALADTYETEAALRIQKDGWSPRAVRLLVEHVLASPESGPIPLLKLAAGCLGRPGWAALNRLNRVRKGLS